jgi:methylenetetrahydrofolate dehydrogenase (NADP+)/methenyltetrahydrofolate cyclohydrolase
MAAKIIDGRAIAGRIRNEVKSELSALVSEGMRRPNLTAVLVGGDPACDIYIRNQRSGCEEAGINYKLLRFDCDVSEKNLIAAIKKCNAVDEVTGIIIHMPLPKHINRQAVLAAVDPLKDVEGITPANLGMLFYNDGRPSVMPCTALAVMECLRAAGCQLKGREVVIVGHSEIVGKSLCLMMLSSSMESATPTVCHIATKDLASHTKRADILVVAVGKPEFIKADMIKKGATVIDVGINSVCVPSGNGSDKPVVKTVGDVDFAGAAEKAGCITPVPGGVGPVTSAVLLKNLLNLYKARASA